MNRPALPASGRCDECGFDAAAMDDAALVDAIASCSLDGLALTDRRPAPAVWSPREYAWHMHDAVDFYRERIELVLTTDRPELASRDFTAAPEPRTGSPDVDGIVSRLRALMPEQWRRVGIGSSGGERDVRRLVARLAHECVHHALDIEKGIRAAGS